MEWVAEFGKWFVVVALVLGGPTLYRRYLSHGSAVRRKLTRSERRVRQLREVTERFERLQVEQRSVEARQAALDRDDLDAPRDAAAGLRGARRACRGGAPRARLDPARARPSRALLDAAASLGDEYTRSASLGHILEIYVQAGLYEQARSHARWVTDATVRDRLVQDPKLAPLLRPEGPAPLLLRPSARLAAERPAPSAESGD